MENFRRFEKWYSKHVIDNPKKKISVKIENSADFVWKINIDFEDGDFKHMKNLFEKKNVSNYNYYSVNAEKGTFKAEGDFTKLDFLFGKFLAYLGEFDLRTYETDYFLMPDIQGFIFEKQKNNYIFLHYTSNGKTARKIMDEGFQFCAFDRTTTKTQNDLIDLNYNHLLRKPFGKFVIVIGISRSLFKKYLDLINKTKNKYIKVEEILTIKEPFENEYGEETFTLHPKFIKGYFNYQTGAVVENPEFDSNFDSELFQKNIKNLSS